MPETVEVSNDGASYLIGGSSADRSIGAGTYTLTDVPGSHPMKLEGHGSPGCAPTLVSASNTVNVGGYSEEYYYYGTVTYSFANCQAPGAAQFRCGYHNLMNLGIPRLTVNAAC